MHRRREGFCSADRTSTHRALTRLTGRAACQSLAPPVGAGAGGAGGQGPSQITRKWGVKETLLHCTSQHQKNEPGKRV